MLARGTVVVLLTGWLAAQTAAPPERPPLGPPAVPPADAPPHLGLIERDGLREHAAWLADDERAGRYTSSKGQQATAKYVADHFQKLGLRPLGDKKGFLQNYPLARVALDASTSLAFGTAKVTAGFAVLLSGKDDKVALAGRFVHCGNGTSEQVKAGLEGRIPVVVLRSDAGGGVGGDLQAIQRYRDIAQKLASRGATAGVVCLLADKGSLANVLNYRGLQPDHPQLRFGNGGFEFHVQVPLLVLAAPQSEALLAHLGAPTDGQGEPTNDKAAGKLVVQVRQDDKGSAANVVAVLDGKSRKSEAVVFSAHHDHVGRRLDGDVFNGADDNASGTAGLLEIAEAFAKGGARPERSVIFLSVSGEELGLWGSAHFADHPTWPADKIVANVNIDMIGRAIADGEQTQMQITPSHKHPKYSSLVRDGVRLGAKFGITFTSGDQYYERSDHYNFAKKGIPVVFFCDGEHPDYHQVTDHADKLDYARMEAVARLAFWTGWNVALGKDRPQELGSQDAW
jgi:hypothetical protein